MHRRRILCVSLDKAISDDPYAVLTEAEYDVVATSDIHDALRLLSRERFDAVVIGHRLRREEKYALAVEAKEKWNIPVVLVCSATAELEIPATCRVSARYLPSPKWSQATSQSVRQHENEAEFDVSLITATRFALC